MTYTIDLTQGSFQVTYQRGLTLNSLVLLGGKHLCDCASAALSTKDSKVGKERQRERDPQAKSIVWLAPASCLASLTLAQIQLSPPQCCPALHLNHPVLPPFRPRVSLLYHSISSPADSFSPCLVLFRLLDLQPRKLSLRLFFTLLHFHSLPSPPLSPSIAAHSNPGRDQCYLLFDPPRISFWVP